MTAREVLLVAHTGRAEALSAAAHVVDRFSAAGLGVRILHDEARHLDLPGARNVPATDQAALGVELVISLGGDGTMLRGAELGRAAEAPVLGVNLGHVGFLAEAERADLDFVVERVLDRDYTVEERMTIDATVTLDGTVTAENWALNDASIEKPSRERLLEVIVEVDGRPLSRWGCDGVVCATPTGSTAYAFSAGGPVVWPQVEALLLVPISAHALFARPLVVSPTSVLAVEVLHSGGPTEEGGVLWCDGRRTAPVPAGARVEVRRGTRPVQLARLSMAPFTDRLVAKFRLPVNGWRGAHESDGV